MRTDPGEGGGTVLGRDPVPLLRGDQTVEGELVEPARGAFGRGELRGVGEQLGRGADGGVVLDGLAGDGERGTGVDGLRPLEHAGEDGDGVAVHRVRGAACAVSATPVTVATWAVLASRPRVSPT
jgi:hypothetical protein